LHKKINLALDNSIVKHYVGYIKLFFFTDYNLLGHILVANSLRASSNQNCSQIVGKRRIRYKGLKAPQQSGNRNMKKISPLRCTYTTGQVLLIRVL